MPRVLPPPRWDLIAESFSEAAFLWSRWEDALDSPRHTLDDVVFWVEERLIGALDGVRLGDGAAVEALLVSALTGRRTRRATVAAYLLASRDRAGVAHVVESMTGADPRRLDALRRGLERSLGAQWAQVVTHEIPRLPAAAQAAVLDALAFRRLPLPPGLDAHLARDAPEVQRSGLRLSATMHEPWTEAYIRWGLSQAEPELQVEAARAATLRGHRGAVERAYELVTGQWPGSEPLLPLCAFASGNRLLPLLQARVAAGDAARETFDALASIGTIEAADVCAAALDTPEQARLAADGLGAITGLDPAPPPGHPQVDDDASADALLLPLPHAESLRTRWQQARRDYRPRQRYFGGRPFSPASLANALATSTMRRRRLLAWELALRTRGSAHVNTTTWTEVQRRQQSALAAA